MQYLNGYRNVISSMNVSIENIKLFLRSKLDGRAKTPKAQARRLILRTEAYEADSLDSRNTRPIRAAQL